MRKRSHMGRPPLPREKTRRNRLVTFLTDLELESVRRQAEQQGLSLSGMEHKILARSLESPVESSHRASGARAQQKTEI